MTSQEIEIESIKSAIRHIQTAADVEGLRRRVIGFVQIVARRLIVRNDMTNAEAISLLRGLEKSLD